MALGITGFPSVVGLRVSVLRVDVESVKGGNDGSEGNGKGHRQARMGYYCSYLIH